MTTRPVPRRRRTSDRPAAAIALVSCLGALAGCATIGSTIIADRDEYLAYRKVRTSDRLNERLASSHAYLQGYPEGQWVGQVEPWFDRAELRFWLRIRETPAGLAAYLKTLPEGPHAAKAAEGLKAHRERQRTARRELLALKAAMTEERLAEIAAQRQRAQEAFTSWLGRFLTIDTWGRRTSQLDHEFIFEWRIDPPAGRCVDDRCSKLVQWPYQLPGGGPEAQRSLVMEVLLILERGMLRETRLEGPGLFSRLYEASAKQPVTHDDPSARVDAIAYAVAVVGGAAEARMPASRCSREAVAPVVLHRACDGWEILVRAAERPGQDDVVSISGSSSDRSALP